MLRQGPPAHPAAWFAFAVLGCGDTVAEFRRCEEAVSRGFDGDHDQQSDPKKSVWRCSPTRNLFAGAELASDCAVDGSDLRTITDCIGATTSRSGFDTIWLFAPPFDVLYA